MSKSFNDLMRRLDEGEQSAWTEIFDRFADRMMHEAKVRMNARFGPKVDAEDIVNSAYRSFFVRKAKGKVSLESWGALCRLLVKITLRKCFRKVEYLQAQCRDVRREVPARPADPDGADIVWEPEDREPTLEEVAMHAETMERLQQVLDEQQWQVLELRLEGHTVKEIASRINRTERHVYRVRDAIYRLVVENEDQLSR